MISVSSVANWWGGVQAFFEENASALFEDECHFSDPGQPVMAQFIYDELVSRQLIP